MGQASRTTKLLLNVAGTAESWTGSGRRKQRLSKIVSQFWQLLTPRIQRINDMLNGNAGSSQEAQ
ncbi:MAG: hypothetical protein AUI36_47595 [Cyanobacteria bacterium 13_1_40CM_2_61_4]|nr:MAG: hypothetical protein AUI36_47595 [Cyanobacteria bacterium 13_1_40CM_2_61_4]